MKRFLFVLCLFVLLSACGKPQNDSSNELQGSELKKTGSLELMYAGQFSVDYYEEGYIHISVADGRDYILVPENKEENNLGLDNPVYIYKPCNNIYLAASSAMDLFLELDALDNIAACSTSSKDYAMEEVKKAIDTDEILYVGKYSAPDYEALLGRSCNLAIESTMISHSPKIKEQLERINIPVFIERSSYEENPIGRLEWIKLYGVLTSKEDDAVSFFDREVKKIEKLSQEKSNVLSGKSVAFFSISSSGYVTVRKPGDYICRMIEMAGGRYALADLPVEEENSLSTINIGMEEFYKEAIDADILIYNGTIDGGVQSLDDLIGKNSLLGDFKAVKEGNAYSTSLNMFQESSKIVEVIFEMSKVIENDTDSEECQYLIRLK